MIPLYGFLQGDTLGLLILAYETETMQQLIEKVQRSAQTRVATGRSLAIFCEDRPLDPTLTVKQAGFSALDRIDIREAVIDV